MEICYKNEPVYKLTIDDLITGELFTFVHGGDIYMKVGGSLSELINSVRLKDGELRCTNKDVDIKRINGTLVID